MESITFEELQECHLPEVLSIYNYYVQNTVVTFHIHEIPLDEMRDIVFFDTPLYKAFVIQCGGKVCGYTILSPFKKREAYDSSAEVTVYLHPDFTGKGIGGQAIRYLEEYAVERKLHALIAIICAENTASMCLFEKNGYVKCAHYREIGRKFGRMLDSVAYQKIL